MRHFEPSEIGLTIGERILAAVAFFFIVIILGLAVGRACAQTIVTGGNRKVFPAYVNPCTVPFYDPFTGTGTLSSCWTPYSTFVATRAGGVAAPASSSFAFEIFTPAATIGADQTATVTINFTAHPGFSGPIVRADTTGAGYLWRLSTGKLVVAASANGNLGTLGTCPVVFPGNVLQLSVIGYTVTCTNLTMFDSDSYDDLGVHYPSGSPGFFVDARSESGVTASAFFASSP